MILLQTLKETAASCLSIKKFGYGDKYFLNNVDRETGLTVDALYPLLWVHSVGMESHYNEYGERKNEYSVLAVIGKGLPKGLDSSKEEIEDAIATCWTSMVQFEQRLQHHESINPEHVIRFKATTFIHDYDLNLFGWAFTFTLKLIEAVPVDCDPVPTEQDYVSAGYAQPGYVE